METTPKQGVESFGGDDRLFSSRLNTQRRKVSTTPRSPFVKRAVEELEQRRQSNRFSSRNFFIHNVGRSGEVFTESSTALAYDNQSKESSSDLKTRMTRFNDLKLLSRTIIKEQRILKAQKSNNEEEIERLKDAHSSFTESLSRSKSSPLYENNIKNLVILEDLDERKRKTYQNKNSGFQDEVDSEEIRNKFVANDLQQDATSEYSVDDEEQLLPQPINLTQILLESSKSEIRFSDSSRRSSERSDFYRRSLLADYKDPIMEREINRITTDIQNNHQFHKRVRRSDDSLSFSSRQSLSSSGSLRNQLDNLLHIDMQKKLQNIENQFEFPNLKRKDSSFIDSSNNDNYEYQDIVVNKIEKSNERGSLSDIDIANKTSSDSSSSEKEMMLSDRETMLVDSNHDNNINNEKSFTTPPQMVQTGETVTDNNIIDRNDVTSFTPSTTSDAFDIVDQSDMLEKQDSLDSEEQNDAQNNESLENKSILSRNSEEEQVEISQLDVEVAKLDANIEADDVSNVLNSAMDPGLNESTHFSKMSERFAENKQDLKDQMSEDSLIDGVTSFHAQEMNSSLLISEPLSSANEIQKTISDVVEKSNYQDTEEISFETGRDLPVNKVSLDDDFMNEMEITGIIAPEDLADYDTSQLSKNDNIEFGLEQVLNKDSDEDEFYYNHASDSEIDSSSEDVSQKGNLLPVKDYPRNKSTIALASSKADLNERFPRKFIKEISKFYIDQPLVDLVETESFDFDQIDLNLFSKLSINSIFKKGRKSNVKLGDNILECLEDISNSFLENQVSDLIELAQFGKRNTVCASDMLLLIKRSRYFKELKKDGKLLDGNVFNYIFSQASELFSVEELNEIQNDCMNK